MYCTRLGAIRYIRVLDKKIHDTSFKILKNQTLQVLSIKSAS